MSEEYWREHPDEARALFHEQVFASHIQSLRIPRPLRKLILRHGAMPIIAGVIQGWWLFEMATTQGIHPDSFEAIIEERGSDLKLDVADFERRMMEFKVVSTADQKPGLQRVKSNA